jgi:hypothetical protein
MVKRRLQLVALLCCFLIGLSACSRKWVVIGAAAAAVGTGAYYYVKGDLKRNYEAPMGISKETMKPRWTRHGMQRLRL